MQGREGWRTMTSSASDGSLSWASLPSLHVVAIADSHQQRRREGDDELYQKIEREIFELSDDSLFCFVDIGIGPNHGPTKREQIDVQGDISYDIVEFITDSWPDVGREFKHGVFVRPARHIGLFYEMVGCRSCNFFFIEDGKKVPA
ncbi:hypothetical protein CsSME_00050825 [Camellia sinensis var. sinensis]